MWDLRRPVGSERQQLRCENQGHREWAELNRGPERKHPLEPVLLGRRDR